MKIVLYMGEVFLINELRFGGVFYVDKLQIGGLYFLKIYEM